jgi:hypothetical protein
MDSGQNDGRAGSKRSYEEFDSDAWRRLEVQLRGRLEQAEDWHQREGDTGHDWDRTHNRSPEWRQGKDHRREDKRRFVAGPSRPMEQQKRKKVGSRSFLPSLGPSRWLPLPLLPLHRHRPRGLPHHRQVTPLTQIRSSNNRARREQGLNASIAAEMATTNLPVISKLTSASVRLMGIPLVCVRRPPSTPPCSGTDMAWMAWASTA